MDKKENVKAKTKIWSKYEKAKEYTEKKRLVSRTERNWNFFIGDQWKGLKSNGEELPMQNFIKTIVQYKVSSVARSNMIAYYSDIEMRPELNEIYDRLNLFFEQCWEKSKMDEVTWRMIKAAAIQGDAYIYWPDGNTLEPPQIIPNTSIFFGDENIEHIQEQPYIIIEERWNIKKLKKFAEKNGVSKEDIEKILTDNETERMIYNHEEVEDKVTVLLYIDKDEEGIVRSGRATETVVIEPVEAKTNVDGEGKIKSSSEVYPIVNFVWEHVPNSMRGVGEVEQLIPNQLELNKTLARRSMAVKMAAYPRMAYDANAIANPEDLDKVGAPIAVQGGNAQSIAQMIAYLNPANIASDALSLSNDLLQTTKDLAGASDYALGNINPEQASGTAIIAVRDQSQVTLSEQNSARNQWVEDVALLWIDLWIVFNRDGISFNYTDDAGNSSEVKISQEELKNLKPTVLVDVSADNEWTKQAEQQGLDNLLQLQQITFEEYVESLPDHSPVPKAKLVTIINKRKALEQQMQMQQQQQMAMQAAQGQVDPQALLQQLVQKGIPEDEATRMVQGYMNGGQQGMNAQM